MRYLIERGPAFAPAPVYLHVFEGEDGSDGFDWSSDRTRALRFGARHDADSFGFANLDCSFFSIAFPADELVGFADQVLDDVVDEFGI